MKSEELRIGNIVEHKYDNGGTEGTFIWNPIRAEDIKWCEEFPDNYRPIPLTEEWFKKFGFEMYCGDWCRRGVKIGEHEPREGETTFKFSIIDVISFESIEIKYVHQLQNLYFALTGEDLQLT